MDKRTKYHIETVAERNNFTGEGAIWDFRNNRLIWVDIDNSLVFQLLPDSGKSEIISRLLPTASVAIDRNGGLMFAGAKGLHVWQSREDYNTIVSEYENQSLCFNDMIAGPFGQIYAGTLYWDEKGMNKTGKLYLICPDRSIRIVEENIEHANGLGFSPDGSILYFTDSAQRCIYAYDVKAKTGELNKKRVFVRVPSNEGIPDGLTVDSEGFVWSAQWYGGQVVRYDPDGKVERRISMPVKQVSSVMFGGNDLTDLYITSAGKYWPSDLIPLGFDPDAAMGGSLYRIRTDIRGKREYMTGFQLVSKNGL
jgi:sugar lactone lactonase YvrE